jgi:hypothetical protein
MGTLNVSLSVSKNSNATWVEAWRAPRRPQGWESFPVASARNQEDEMTSPHLTPEQRRALELLASSQHGINAEQLVRGYGVSRRALARLVGGGLAAVERIVMVAEGKAVEVVRLRITAAGRRRSKFRAP